MGYSVYSKSLLRSGLALAFAGLSIHAQAQSPAITSWVLNRTGLTGYNCSGCTPAHYGTIAANIQHVYYTTTDVYIKCAAIPSYNIGPWPGNPNVPSDQNLVEKIPLNPTPNTGTPTAVPMGKAGVWSNGVTMYNPKDGFYWDTTTHAFGNTIGVTGQWNRNAYLFEGPSFDACLGHPDQGGSYHNHVNPTCIYDATATTVHSPIIGYAFDGYPVYGAYAYSDTNGTGAIRRMRSSYVLTTATTRSGGPTMSAYAAGTFIEDFVYTPGAGDLDQHNGRWCKTPEYPSGTYAYFVTIDSTGTPQYPFILGPTYYGNVVTTDIGMTGGHNTVPTGATEYIPTAVIEENVASNEVIVAPNPAPSSDIRFEIPNTNKNVLVSLIDFQGRALVIKNLQAGKFTANQSFSAPQLGAGMYLLRFEFENGERIVKRVEVIEE